MKCPRVALMLDGSRVFDAEVIKGITKYVRMHGPWQLHRQTIGSNQRYSLTSDALLKEVQKFRPDGVVMHESGITKQLLQHQIPTVVIPSSKTISSGYYLNNDNETTGRIAAKHLLSLELSNFGFIGFDDVSWSMVRMEAFRHDLFARGFDLHEYLVPQSKNTRVRLEESKKLKQWLLKLPKPIGVFAGNDDLARLIAEHCQQQDIQIPKDVAILGADNDELICELNNPPLSSIPFTAEQAGFEVATMLDSLMKGHLPKSNCVLANPLAVVVRDSSNLPARANPDEIQIHHPSHKKGRQAMAPKALQ